MKKSIITIILTAILIISLPYFSVMAQEESDEFYTCPANSYLSGDQCLCNAGYIVPSGGSSCVPESQACNAFGPSHLVGNDCVCDSGYGILPGSSICQSLSAACAQYNAIWSDSAGDCVCPTGWHEDSSGNNCIQDQTATPAETEPEKKPDSPVEKTDTTPETITPPTISIEDLPVITKIELPPIESDQSFKIIDDLMQPVYDQYPESLKTFVIETQPLLEKAASKTYEPAIDLYSIKFNNELNFKPILGETLPLIDPSAQTVANQQLTTLTSFSNQDINEISIKSSSMIETLAENVTDKAFIQELIEYHQQVAVAEKELKVKPGVDKEKLAIDIELEEKLKWQIANLEQIQRYNHMRIIEVTSHMRQLGPNRTEVVFEQMPSDYQEFFGGKSGSSDFEEAEEGVEFNRAFANITGATQQLKDLKATLKKNYPAGWKSDLFDLPAKPDRATTRQKIDKNIFLYMMDQSNLSI